MKRSEWWLMVTVVCLSNMSSITAMGAVAIAAGYTFYYSFIEAEGTCIDEDEEEDK